MITTIIFDMGGVIIDYDPALYTRRVTQDPAEMKILEDAVFHSESWARLDAGTITLDAFDRFLDETVPAELRSKAHDLLHHWHENLPVFAGMERLMACLYEKGIPLYLLSNAGEQFHTYSKKIPAFRYLSGIALSADLKMVKPGPEIFQWLLSTYGLKAEECLFIDDYPPNVKGTEAVGIHGYSYADGDLKKLCLYLAELDLLDEREIQEII